MTVQEGQQALSPQQQRKASELQLTVVCDDDTGDFTADEEIAGQEQIYREEP